LKRDSKEEAHCPQSSFTQFAIRNYQFAILGDIKKLRANSPDPVIPMFDGPTVVQALRAAGVTHVVWLPDSELGTWDAALRAESSIQLIRATREGEAIGIAAGLMIGGKQPIVAIQCTGLFEAGDALRNVIHDLKLPLFLIIGLRSYYAYQQKNTFDTCPVFAEPILRTWQIPYRLLGEKSTIADLIAAYQEARKNGKAGAVFVAE
jgi:sulfopyruvate decarboxylase TPP-binding subunit